MIVGYSASGNTTFSIMKLYAKSGSVRLCNSIWLYDATGTTVNRLRPTGHVWNNTVDNLTSITFYDATSIQAGTRITILKGDAFPVTTPTGGAGAWKLVQTQVLGSAASSVTFSGLNGNTAVCYYGSCSVKPTASLATRLTYNSDSGTNYGYQLLRGSSTDVSAYRDAIAYHLNPTTTTTAYTSLSNFILFAKSGFIRPSIFQSTRDVNGTSVSAIDIWGCSYNNTSDNITQIVNTASTSTFAAGTQFDLYALYV